jgi:hypothetical protein
MPAAVAVPLAVAAIGAGGAVANAKIQSNAAKRAAMAQQQAATQGIDYQKGRDAIADSRYDKKWQMYQQAVADYQRRHGGGGGPGGVSIPNLIHSSGGGQVPVSLADLVNGQQGAADSGQQAQPGSIADTAGGWNDWQRYGA